MKGVFPLRWVSITRSPEPHPDSRARVSPAIKVKGSAMICSQAASSPAGPAFSQERMARSMRGSIPTSRKERVPPASRV
jgi:hypothetical protein